MFFVLSKILVFLLKPFLWALACFFVAVLMRAPKWRKRFFYAGLALLLVFSNPLLLREVFSRWEVPAMEMGEITEPYDVAIVLGGFSRPRQYPRDRMHIGFGGGRLINAVELYREGKVRALVISGGSGAVLGEKISEAATTRRFLRRLGIPEEVIITDEGSRNTHENALASARLLEALDSEGEGLRCLLVTSGYHMRRAQACFERVGVSVTPFTTDHEGGGARSWSWSPKDVIVPSAGAFAGWDTLFKEWAGIVVYKIRGWV